MIRMTRGDHFRHLRLLDEAGGKQLCEVTKTTPDGFYYRPEDANGRLRGAPGYVLWSQAERYVELSKPGA